MTNNIQLNLFSDNYPIQKEKNAQEWGTFKDSLQAPIYRWFTYPAGFSYKAVEHSFERFNVISGQTVYDPFMGSGTTNLTAQKMGIHSYGVEAHPFVYQIAKAKMNWNINLREIRDFLSYVQKIIPLKIKEYNDSDFQINQQFPELVLKCYDEPELLTLFCLREIILSESLNEDLRNFFYVVVTALLREVSKAETGWPYIAPKKLKSTSLGKDVLKEFCYLTISMSEDIETMKSQASQNYEKAESWLFNSDSRNTHEIIDNESIDHVFTSPPYLNNFDYADRTRLELYFWGIAKCWKDITNKVRSQLITSATTQVTRSDPQFNLSENLQQECPLVYEFLDKAITQLEQLRKVKEGKKSYDLMVSGYFNDIYQVLKDVYRVLKPQTKALFILGDSAPYGVHIPTDELIAKMGLCIGFNDYTIEVLRLRGRKWKKNPQRHTVELRESIVILSKR